MAVRLYIPTLQEYAKKRRKENSEFVELFDCETCEFCKSSLGACIWGENVRKIETLNSCPMAKNCIS